MTTPAVFILGNFDGVHRGHQKLIKDALAYARSHKLKPRCAAVSFWPHPQIVLQRQKPLHLLQTEDERTQHLMALGLDDIVTLEFTRHFAELHWQDFVQKVLLQQPLTPVAIFVGKDFRFGRKREGTAQALKDYLEPLHIGVFVEEKIKESGEPISSSRIRAMVQEGNVEGAAQLLGYPYSIFGVVRRGDGRGKELGFPTANILIAQDLAYKVLPRFGVYVTRCLLDRESFPSITNVGLKPTFETASVVNVESNIFDFNRDIYGHFLRVEFLKFMRAEKKFASREALIQQIQSDIAAARDPASR